MIRLASIVLLLATSASAQDLATGETIRAAISGNTVEGSMIASGGYTEFYDPSGSIRGEGYTGRWSIQGDEMCFDYGAGPATCWSVRIAGASVTWIADGIEEGTGTVVQGNPRGF